MIALPQEIIARKRDKHVLNQDEIQNFVTGLVDKSWSDAQVSAMAMAIFLNGMDLSERRFLTQSMAHSGDVLTWESFNLDGPILDKHSTGGVGDKVSLIVGAIVAAAGGYMPKMSGRGLGHTGGTVDKMQAIPGYQINPDQDLFRQTVKSTGFAIIGQTGSLAPADKRLYALRDVTGTIESIDLIASSILSKKLAVSPDNLVLDVKAGSGAFMATTADATNLAEALVAIGNEAGVQTSALVTDMDQVLGRTVGNAVEVLEAIQFLKEENVEPRLAQVCLALAERLIDRSGLSTDASNLAHDIWTSGQAAEKFAAMVTSLGGPADLMEKPEVHLGTAELKVHKVTSERSGWLSLSDTSELGMALVELGGGRVQADDEIDPLVGLSMHCETGDKVEVGDDLVSVFARDTASLERALNRINSSLKIQEEKPETKDAILASVG